MLQFLTKLPLPFEIHADAEDFSKGVIYFPLVGLIIGLLMAGVYSGVVYLSNTLVASVLVVAFEIFITGGLHLDGLADSFDGLYSYRDKERMLEIMKDSRVGTNGVLVLVVVIILKIALIYSIKSPLYILILMPAVSRCMIVVLAATSKYARQKGMGGFFIEKTTKLQLVIALVLTLMAHLIQVELLAVSLVILVLTFLYRWHVYTKIDGVTGDILGSAAELSEVFYLLVAVLMLGV